ncbi:hypothetical protein [Streptomyces sp. NPDC051665]|uniref:hypothetical protein n=1 Tax=Streptomyces sp. NPDC051665 TaxID=3154647 RepID=UPI00341AC73F
MASIDWGTVPAWLSAVLTGGSITLGFYIILRDHKKQDEADATELEWVMPELADRHHPFKFSNLRHSASPSESMRLRPAVPASHEMDHDLNPRTRTAP